MRFFREYIESLGGTIDDVRIAASAHLRIAVTTPDKRKVIIFAGDPSRNTDRRALKKTGKPMSGGPWRKDDNQRSHYSFV